MVGAAGNVFIELGLVIIVAAFAAYILRVFRQPQILAYVLVGILVTPVFQLITDTSVIESMSIIGIAFLLFIVGLEMDLKALKNVALVSGFGGAIQITVLFVIGYFVSLLLGFLSLEAAYIGLMIAFSSTMVVIKLLSDRHELNTLHGRITIGILLVQDIVAIFALSILTSIDGFSASLLIMAFLKFISLFALAYIASKALFPAMFRYAAQKQELLLITSLAVCFVFALAFHFLGFSLAIGAFIAGLALGNLDYNLEIIGKVKSLKDFFSLLFFVSLGMGLSVGVLKDMWLPLIVILLVVMVVKPFVIMLVCTLFKYTKKPSFLTANSLAQIGEFSLILGAQGLMLGHITQDIFSFTVVVTLVSITLTSYYIEYSGWFFRLFRKPLKIFDSFTTEGLEYLPTQRPPKIVLCGYNRIGYNILHKLHKERSNLLVVDYNPEVIAEMVDHGYHCIYGDVSDEEILDRMNLSNITILISTIPTRRDNLLLLRKVRSVNRKVKIFIAANTIDEALSYYEHGADYVVLPHFLGGEHVANMVANFQVKKLKLHVKKKDHIKHLKHWKKLGHEHPKVQR